jgi:hypothetical protein
MLCLLRTSKRRRTAADKLAATDKDRLPPGLAQPALRALARASYSDLSQLTALTKADRLKLYGMGPRAVGTIQTALAERSLVTLPEGDAHFAPAGWSVSTSSSWLHAGAVTA